MCQEQMQEWQCSMAVNRGQDGRIGCVWRGYVEGTAGGMQAAPVPSPAANTWRPPGREELPQKSHNKPLFDLLWAESPIQHQPMRKKRRERELCHSLIVLLWKGQKADMLLFKFNCGGDVFVKRGNWRTVCQRAHPHSGALLQSCSAQTKIHLCDCLSAHFLSHCIARHQGTQEAWQSTLVNWWMCALLSGHYAGMLLKLDRGFFFHVFFFFSQ